MKLEAYLKKERMTQREFAKLINVDESTLSHWLKGLHRPSWPAMLNIVNVTNGQVKPNDFFEGKP